MARQLAALTGLGPLSHLDLDLFSGHQIFSTDTETTGSDLLDFGVGPITVRVGLETLRILTALARVGLRADTVHSNGEHFVSLGTDRPH